MTTPPDKKPEFVFVPVEPTREMIAASEKCEKVLHSQWNGLRNGGEDTIEGALTEDFPEIYKAMIAARPAAPVTDDALKSCKSALEAFAGEFTGEHFSYDGDCNSYDGTEWAEVYMEAVDTCIEILRNKIKKATLQPRKEQE